MRSFVPSCTWNLAPQAVRRNIWSRHSWICVGADAASIAMSGSQSKSGSIRAKNEISQHIENLRSFATEFNEATDAEKVEAVLATFSPFYSNTVRDRWPLQTDDDPSTWGPKIAKGLLAWIPPRRHEQADEFIAMVDLEAFDMALARLERLDAMIDRTIKRLMQIRTMKQMHGRFEPKLINVPSTRDASALESAQNRSTE